MTVAFPVNSLSVSVDGHRVCGNVKCQGLPIPGEVVLEAIIDGGKEGF